MADNVVITPGVGKTIAADEVADATLGTISVQYVKLMDGTLDGTTKAAVGANGLAVDPSGVTSPVSGTFWQATQPVSGTFWQATQPVSIASMPSTPVTGTFWQATQPVSGSVTANIGTPGSLALDATLTGGTLQSKITDGTRVATVKAASTASIATDLALVVAISPNNTVPVSGTFWQATQPVSGTFWQATQPVSGTFWQATQPVSGTFWQATQPVSGTVTTSPPANASTNVAQINAVTPLMGNGVTGTGSQRVTIASDNTAFSVNAACTGTFWQTTQPVSGTFWQTTQPVSGTVAVTGTFWQATQPISAASLPLPTGAALDSSLATLHTDLTSALPAGTNLIGRAVADASSATGGIPSTARLASAAASTNGTRVKASAGRIYQASGKNNAAYDVFLVLYDATTNPPVPGTTAIRKKIVCPALQAFVYDWPVGLEFATGIGYAFTKLVADADTTALVAADITAFNLDYV